MCKMLIFRGVPTTKKANPNRFCKPQKKQTPKNNKKWDTDPFTELQTNRSCLFHNLDRFRLFDALKKTYQKK